MPKDFPLYWLPFGKGDPGKIVEKGPHSGPGAYKANGEETWDPMGSQGDFGRHPGGRSPLGGPGVGI